jgi:hypothetical protein
MKDVNTIIKELITRAKELAPNFNWEPQTVVSRLFLSVPALEMSNLYLVAEYLHRLMSFDGIKSLLTDDNFKTNLANALSITKQEVENLINRDLEYFGERFGIKRKSATYSRGMITLYFSTSDSVSIPANTTFIAKNGVEYISLVDITGSPRQDSETGLFRLDFLIQCKEKGSIGNVPAGFITRINRVLPNFVSLTNLYPFTNGMDEEDWLTYLDRVKFLRFSSSYGSKSWLEALLMSNINVLDAKVYTANDNVFLRRYGAEIWVVDYEIIEQDSLSGTENEKYVLYPPALNILTNNANIIRGTVYNDVYSFSVFAKEKIVRIAPGVITFTYDKTIYYLQEVVSDPEFWFLGGERNVVIRKALPCNVKVEVKVYPTHTAIDKEVLKQKILGDLQVFLNGGTTSYGVKYNRVKIGTQFDISDMLNVIIDNPEVDRVDISSFKVYLKHYYSNDYNIEPEYVQARLEFFEYPVFDATNSIIKIGEELPA